MPEVQELSLPFSSPSKRLENFNGCLSKLRLVIEGTMCADHSADQSTCGSMAPELHFQFPALSERNENREKIQYLKISAATTLPL